MDTKLLVLSKNSHKIREELSVSLQRRVGMPFFTRVAMLDPTTRKNVGNVLVVGEYATWIAKRFFTDIEQNRVSIEKFFREDADKVTPDLRVYHAKKLSLKVEQQDINNIDGFVALYQVVQMLRKVRSKRQQKKEVIKDVIELTTGNPNKRVLIPTSKMAAQKIQTETRWCTGATESENKFDYYFRKGYLYDVFIRNTESNKIDKYQFHFENGEFMNELDQPIDDVYGFFKEHQEVANAIAEHRKSVNRDSDYAMKDYLIEMSLLNQKITKNVINDFVAKNELSISELNCESQDCVVWSETTDDKYKGSVDIYYSLIQDGESSQLNMFTFDGDGGFGYCHRTELYKGYEYGREYYADALAFYYADTLAFFVDNQEIADAIYNDRKSSLISIDDLYTFNQPIPEDLCVASEHVSWWYVYGLVQGGRLTNEQGNALLPKDFNFKFCGEHQATIIVDDWNELVEIDSEVIEDALTDDDCLDPMNHALSDAIRNAIRQTLSIVSDRKVEIDGKWKLEITVDLEAFPLSEIFNMLYEYSEQISYLDLFISYIFRKRRR